MKWQPKDCVALVSLVILGVLLALGHDSYLVDIFIGIIAVYVGIDIAITKRKKK